MIYLDNNATTRPWPEVVDAMLPYLEEKFSNPSSPNRYAREVAVAVRHAREHVAGLLGVEPEEVVFTSCGTESNNTALYGTLHALPDRNRIVTTRVEHPAVLNRLPGLEERGYEIITIPVDGEGALDIDMFTRALDSRTALVSVMHANNETGVIFPVEELAEKTHASGALFHTDMVQVAGKLPVDLKTTAVDLASLSAHKFHGPKGVGVLVVREDVDLNPYLAGGEQEYGRRAGTENTPGIIGVGIASQIAMEGLSGMQQVQGLRDRLEEGILSSISNTRVIGGGQPRLPNTLSMYFEDIEAEPLIALLDMEDICCSAGSACASGGMEPSHVLSAMGLSRDEARHVIRFSLSRMNTGDEIDRALDLVNLCLRKLRNA